MKAGTKSGTAEMKQSDNADGMVEALMEMSSFCDRALRAQEDGDTSPLDTEVRQPSLLSTAGESLHMCQHILCIVHIQSLHAANDSYW